MKVCFYLDNNDIESIDFSNPERGNPGIGGTEFMFWIISYYLKKIYSDMEVVVFAPNIDKMPKEVVSIKSVNELDAVRICKKIGGDIFVFRGPYHDKKLFDLIDELKVKSITWSHNFESIMGLRYAINCNYLKRNICVGKEQYDKLRDHKIFEKSNYIYNCLDFTEYKRVKNINKKNIVCFMGGLRATKGFHILAQVWKSIIKEVPDAELHVMGGAKLYNENANIGSYGIAEPTYEERFMPHIVNDDGTVIESVKFLGVLNGEDKINEINRTKVGIANPSGFGETFCISAIEFEALGVPVVSSRKNGLLDTVCNGKSGILVSNKRQLVKAIVKLLKDNNLNYEMGIYGEKYVREKFSVEKTCSDWKLILDDVYNDENKKLSIDYDKLKYNLKWSREINRRVKKNSLFKKLPAIMEYEERLAPIFRKV